MQLTATEVAPIRSLNQTALASFVAGITGTNRDDNGFSISIDKNVRIALPGVYSKEHLTLAARDSEILSDILKEYPDQVLSMISAVSSGNFSEATDLAEKIGISERNFVAKGGGMWAIILLAVACALLLEHD